MMRCEVYASGAAELRVKSWRALRDIMVYCTEGCATAFEAKSKAHAVFGYRVNQFGTLGGYMRTAPVS